MQDSENLNQHVPGYELHDVLGGGAMSIVFHAVQEGTGEERAIKLLRPEHLDRTDLRQRFEREAKISSTITHPNIIQIEKYDVVNNIPYMVMPLLNHVTLGDQIDKEGPLPVGEAVEVAIKILDALAALHRENVIHRDLKAENILYTMDGEPVLTDLGLAYAQLDTRITSIGTGPLGTPQYMAPEQWMGETGDRQSDIFSAGVLLFYMLTGSFPFPSRSARAVVSQIINGVPDDIPTTVQPDDVREKLQAVVFKAVSSDPSDRFKSAREMEEALQKVYDEHPELAERDEEMRPRKIAEHSDSDKSGRTTLTSLISSQVGHDDDYSDLGYPRKRVITNTNLRRELGSPLESPPDPELKSEVGESTDEVELLSEKIISTLSEIGDPGHKHRTSGAKSTSRVGSKSSSSSNHLSQKINEYSSFPKDDVYSATPRNEDFGFSPLLEGEDEVTEVIPQTSLDDEITLAEEDANRSAKLVNRTRRDDDGGHSTESAPSHWVHKIQLTETTNEATPQPIKDKNAMPQPNDETNPQKLAINPVEIAPGSYWVGKRTPGDFFFANPYLRTFKGNNEEFNLIIDPGSSTDFAIVQAKCSRIIGNLSKINATFINHQDPDVGSSVGPLIGRYSPGAYCLCTEDTWRLVHYYNIPRERFVPLEKYPNGFRLPTGHKLIPVPSPFCHFVGAMMIYDPETCVLYSGDLFGGLTDKNAKGLWADESDWVGVRAFHQIYMPTRTALANAIMNIRNIKGELKIIAPQHGRLLTGDIMHEFMDRLQALSCGLDILSDRQATPDELLAWTTVLNRILKRASDFTTEDLYEVVLKNSALEGLLSETSNGIEVRKMGKYTIEQSLRTICMTIGDKDIEGMIKYEAVYATSELGLPTPNMDIDEGGVPHSKGSMLGSVVD